MYDRRHTKMTQSTVSKRVNLTLPDSVFEELEAWADQQGRPTANLAAFIVESAVKQAKEAGEFVVKPSPAKK
jgi:CopG-like RHH_1 or ribbon-helix-helix domain, RHH_5